MLFSPRFWSGIGLQVLFFTFFATLVVPVIEDAVSVNWQIGIVIGSILIWLVMAFTSRTFRMPIQFVFSALTLGLFFAGFDNDFDVEAEEFGGDFDLEEDSQTDFMVEDTDSLHDEYVNSVFPTMNPSFETDFTSGLEPEGLIEGFSHFDAPLSFAETQNLAVNIPASQHSSLYEFFFESEEAPVNNQASFAYGKDLFDTDMDNDGVYDGMSEQLDEDMDNDGTSDQLDRDRDNDFTSDHLDLDMDNDRTMDHLDVDMDNDGTMDHLDFDKDNDQR